MAGVYTTRPLNNVSIAAAGASNSTALNMDSVSKIRPHVETSGADITVTIQASSDGGGTWANIVSYAAGATGIQAVIDLPGVLVRVRAANAGAGTQSVTVSLTSLRE